MMRCCARMSSPTDFICSVAEGHPLQGCREIAEHCAGEGEAGMSLPEDCKLAGR